MRLEEMPLDIGYASDEVTLRGRDGKKHLIGGQNGKTQLIITAPFIDDAFIRELIEIDAMLPKGSDYEVTAALVVANDTHETPELGSFDFFIDRGVRGSLRRPPGGRTLRRGADQSGNPYLEGRGHLLR